MNRIQGTTTLTGLLGYPLKHSKSPHMHNSAYDKLGLDYVYLAFELQEGRIEEGLQAMKTLGAAGWNVTMPHKEKVLAHLDEVSQEARLIGSCNTVKNNGGHLTGYNTDGRGFIESLHEKGIAVKGEKVVMAGAGGAGKAVAVCLALEGVRELVIFNRELDRPEELAERIMHEVKDCTVRAELLDEEHIARELKDAVLFVNTTSMGMKGQEELSAIEHPESLPQHVYVYDVVYAPDETKLMKVAKQAGCRTQNGLDMMLWQGAIAFKIFTGEDMPLDYVRQELAKL